MKRLLTFFLAGILVFTFGGLVWAAPATGFVNDQAGVLSTEQKLELENLAVAYEAESGNEIAVLIAPELGDESVEEMAIRIFEEWGVGKKGEDNGVLILLAIKDRKVRIEVGYGLEGVLTDLRSKQIIDRVMVPELKKENYFGALKGAMVEIKAMIEGEGSSPAVSAGGEVNDSKIVWYVFIGYLVLAIFSRTKSWWLGGVLGAIFGLLWWGALGALGLAVLGLIVDFLLSKVSGLPMVRRMGKTMGGWGGSGSSGGGSFGGFGGGGSGGGGSSGSW